MCEVSNVQEKVHNIFRILIFILQEKVGKLREKTQKLTRKCELGEKKCKNYVKKSIFMRKKYQ